MQVPKMPLRVALHSARLRVRSLRPRRLQLRSVAKCRVRLFYRPINKATVALTISRINYESSRDECGFQKASGQRFRHSPCGKRALTMLCAEVSAREKARRRPFNRADESGRRASTQAAVGVFGLPACSCFSRASRSRAVFSSRLLVSFSMISVAAALVRSAIDSRLDGS